MPPIFELTPGRLLFLARSAVVIRVYGLPNYLRMTLICYQSTVTECGKHDHILHGHFDVVIEGGHMSVVHADVKMHVDVDAFGVCAKLLTLWQEEPPALARALLTKHPFAAIVRFKTEEHHRLLSAQHSFLLIPYGLVLGKIHHLAEQCFLDKGSSEAEQALWHSVQRRFEAFVANVQREVGSVSIGIPNS